MRRLVTALSCLALLLAGLVLAWPAAASDTPIALPSIPNGYFDFRHIAVDDSAGFVFLSTVNGIEVRNLAGGAVTSLAVGSADGLAVSPDGTTLYAALPDQHAIGVLDTGTLTWTASLPTGSSVSPRTLARTGNALWFGYDDLTTSFRYGGIGVLDLSQPSPAVTVPAPIANDTGTAVRWNQAPALASSPAAPGALFAADRLTSPRPVEKFTASGTSLTLAAASDPAVGSYAADLAVTGDGMDLLVPDGSRVARLRTADLTTEGYLDGDGPLKALAVAPDDGRFAIGNAAPIDQPAVYTYAADGTFVYQYAYRHDNGGTAAAGLAFDSTGDTLYAVTQAWDSSTPGGWRYSLHVVTNTHDTLRPPAPEILTAAPDYRTIDLSWIRLGHYDPAKVDSFTIYRGTAPDQLSAYAHPAANHASGQSWTDTDVAPGTRYYYAVTATNAAGESDRTETASAIRNDLATVFVTRQYATVDGDLDLVYLSDGGPTHRITATGGNYSDPAVAPDGTAVAYARTDSSGTSLWRIPLAGGTAQQLTTGGAADSWPTWSPDGTTLAFTRTTPGGSSIWTVPAAGGTAVAVPGTAGERQPSWSPGGRLLAVTDATADASRVVVTNLDGSYRRAVVGTNGNLPSDKCYSPATGPAYPQLCHYSGAAASWSPDGASLVFLQTTPGGTTPAIVPAAGGSVDYSLFQAFGRNHSVFWSPDGSRIVGSDEPSDNDRALWQVAPNGTARSRLGPLGTWSNHPSVAAARDAYQPLSSPGPVTGVTAVLGAAAVTLHWTRPADAAYVTIRRSAAGGSAPATATDGVAVYTGTATAATATGLANGATYRFSIFSLSALGDVGSAAAATAVPGAVPAVTPTGSVLAALYGIGPGFTASWGKALPTGQVYDVQLGSRTFDATSRTWSASPAWTALLTGTTRTSQVVRATAGTTYYLRARVRDSYGNATAWSAAATAPVPYDDRSAGRTSGWTEAGATGRYLADLSVAHQAGAALQWRVSGSDLSLVTDRCAGCGQFRVYVDGVLRATVDTHASTTLIRQTSWRLHYAGIGVHTVRVVVVGTAGRPTVRVDALVAIR